MCNSGDIYNAISRATVAVYRRVAVCCRGLSCHWLPGGRPAIHRAGTYTRFAGTAVHHWRPGGAPYQEDGEYSGPVVNSERQLWSVAANLSAVHTLIFGLRATPAGLEIAETLREADG